MKQLFFHFISIIIITCVFLYMYYQYHLAPIEPGAEPPVIRDTVYRESKWISDLIEGAATPTELLWLETQIFEFEERHRSHMDVTEVFSQLMAELQARHNILSVKSIQSKKSLG